MIFKDFIVAQRYKGRIFGVRLEGPAYILCDNHGVVKNMITLDSVLHKKHNTINYHSVCEAISADILRIGKEYGETNFVDLLTNVMTGQKCWDLCYHIFS